MFKKKISLESQDKDVIINNLARQVSDLQLKLQAVCNHLKINIIDTSYGNKFKVMENNTMGGSCIGSTLSNTVKQGL